MSGGSLFIVFGGRWNMWWRMEREGQKNGWTRSRHGGLGWRSAGYTCVREDTQCTLVATCGWEVAS